jgi:hypothetical protein
MNDEEIILNVESGRYVMTIEDAMRISEILGSSRTIGNEWRKGVTDFVVYRKPNHLAAAITPFHGALRIEVETNMREKEKNP